MRRALCEIISQPAFVFYFLLAGVGGAESLAMGLLLRVKMLITVETRMTLLVSLASLLNSVARITAVTAVGIEASTMAT